MGQLGILIMATLTGSAMVIVAVASVWLGISFLRKRAGTSELQVTVDDLADRLAELEERVDLQQRYIERLREQARLEPSRAEPVENTPSRKRRLVQGAVGCEFVRISRSITVRSPIAVQSL